MTDRPLRCVRSFGCAPVGRSAQDDRDAALQHLISQNPETGFDSFPSRGSQDARVRYPFKSPAAICSFIHAQREIHSGVAGKSFAVRRNSFIPRDEIHTRKACKHLIRLAVASLRRSIRLACGLGQVAALTVRRTVIHYRALRFATLKGKPLRTSDARPYGMRLCRRDAAESTEKPRFTLCLW